MNFIRNTLFGLLIDTVNSKALNFFNNLGINYA